MKKNVFLIKVIVYSCFVIALLHYFFPPSEPNPFYQWSLIFLVCISTISFFIFKKIEYKNIQWVSISTIFIFGYLIVFYQMAILDLIGYEVPKRFYDWVWADKTVINKVISLATLGLLGFYLGAISFKNDKLYFSKKIYNANSVISTRSIAFLLLLSYIFYILFIITSGSYVYGEYYAKDAMGISVYFYKLFLVSLSASIIVKVSYITSFKNKKLSFRKYLSNFGKPLLALLLWHLFFSLFVGDRDQIIYFSLLTFGVYVIRWKRPTLIQIILMIFVLSTFLTIVGDIRQGRYSGVGYYERVVEAFSGLGSGDKITKKFDEHVPLGETIELALSVRTINHVLLNVPENYDYRYGLYQLQHIYSIIPGMANKINSILHGDDTKFDGSSSFVTYLIQGPYPTYGDGTSVLADLYLDFGVFGVIIGLYLFGYFIRKNEFKLFSGYQKPTLLWIATLIFLSQSLYVSRSSIGLELANIILIYILVKINIQIVLFFKKDKRNYLKGLEKKI